MCLGWPCAVSPALCVHLGTAQEPLKGGSFSHWAATTNYFTTIKQKWMYVWTSVTEYLTKYFTGSPYFDANISWQIPPSNGWTMKSLLSRLCSDQPSWMHYTLPICGHSNVCIIDSQKLDGSHLLQLVICLDYLLCVMKDWIISLTENNQSIRRHFPCPFVYSRQRTCRLNTLCLMELSPATYLQLNK